MSAVLAVLAAGWTSAIGVWEVRDLYIEGTKMPVRAIRAVKLQPRGNHLRSTRPVEGALPTGGVALYGSRLWRDYEAEVVLCGGSDVGNILFRAQDAFNCLQFGVFGGRARLYVIKNGAARIIAEKPYKWRFPLRIRVKVVGDEVECYLDDDLVFKRKISPMPFKTGKIGVQTNHKGYFAAEPKVKVFAQERPPERVGELSIEISVRPTEPGLRWVEAAVKCQDPRVVDEITGEARYNWRGKWLPVTLYPFVYSGRRGDAHVWRAEMFSMAEGEYAVVVTVKDIGGRVYKVERRFTVVAPPDMGEVVDGERVLPFNPVWVGAAMHDLTFVEERVTNYLWEVTLGERPKLAPFSLREWEPTHGSRLTWCKPWSVTLDFPAGKLVRRHLRKLPDKFELLPVWEFEGGLRLEMHFLTGSPVVYFDFSEPVPLCLKGTKGFIFVVPWGEAVEAERLGGVKARFLLFYKPSESGMGPICGVFSPEGLEASWDEGAGGVRLGRLQHVRLFVLDAYEVLDRAPGWVWKAARLCGYLSSIPTKFRFLKPKVEKGRVTIPLAFEVTEPGRVLVPITWAASDWDAPSIALKTSFGTKHFALLSVSGGEGRINLSFPVPDLGPEVVAPKYAPLKGWWGREARWALEFALSLQKPDGTFERYRRMDWYSLGRMAFAFMLGYSAIPDDLKPRVAEAVRKALDNLWVKQWDYEPLTGLCAGYCDANLGYAHGAFAALLYALHVDPGYVRTPEMREKIKEVIRFQWASQDWNGDVWRVVIGGCDAAGGGDGFEEDLVMVLPLLAKVAGLPKGWVDLAWRVCALKAGALKNFDYLTKENIWGFETLTPIHHPTWWHPDGGPNLKYRCDIWWTGPSICGAYYGPWYALFVYDRRIFENQWYRVMEGYGDAMRDGRHWLTVGALCAEAFWVSPEKAAAKMARLIVWGKERGPFSEKVRGEIIWNLPHYVAAMAIINDLLARKYPGFVPLGPARTDDFWKYPALAWRDGSGKTFAFVAAYRAEPEKVTVEFEGKRGTARVGPEGWAVVELE